ncbi:hypothetical protein NMK71_04950 [Weeksellaceae bacterium KMM 9713]|uniref:Uncharacterized protein n=1 Tax=Profundicola chukchiensis TaxID=2961959 RepID=A0A9X4MXE5_9FLAO|nr:hypothetical protein [Profundicola chukchiensis]MDG4945754.1 hypothetical protein [Profundicola chukchiensis]
MNNILYLYRGKKSKVIDNCTISNIELSGEYNHHRYYQSIKQELEDKNALIIDVNIFVNETEVFEFSTYIRISHHDNWDIPIFLYANKGLKNLYQLLKSDYTNISKTNRFELINDSEFLINEITGEPKILQTIKVENNKLLEWNNFIESIEIKNQETNNHTISNEWAIYRWATLLDIQNDEIEKIYSKVENNLYFKYLKAKYPIFDIEKLNKNDLKIQYTGKPKILLIDDESEKGWHEILAYLLRNYNNLDFDYLGEDFKENTSNFIIEKSLNKIKSDDIDIVILDFRLNSDDFKSKLTEVTSVRLLQKIKEYNPGIQVIIFSATNKIWNLQVLQKYGCDGFLIKDSVNFQVNKNFTRNSIKAFKSMIKFSIQKIFIKDLFEIYDLVSENLENLDYEDYSNFEKFKNDLQSQLMLIKESSKLIDPQIRTTIDIVFLNCFNFLEQFKNHYLHNDDEYYLLGDEGEVLQKYYFSKNKEFNKEGDFRKIQNDKYTPTWFNVLSSLAVDYFSICNTDSEILDDLDVIKDNRNDFLHNKKEHFKQSELETIVNIMYKFSEKMKE